MRPRRASFLPLGFLPPGGAQPGEARGRGGGRREKREEEEESAHLTRMFTPRTTRGTLSGAPGEARG